MCQRIQDLAVCLAHLPARVSCQTLERFLSPKKHMMLSKGYRVWSLNEPSAPALLLHCGLPVAPAALLDV